MQYGQFNSIRAVATANHFSTSISSSTSFSLNSATETVWITAVAQPILLKWGAVASTSAFDAIIPVGVGIFLGVPFQSDGLTKYTTFQVIETTTSATVAVVEF